MSKFFPLIVILLSGILCLTGCGSDDDDGDSNAAASGSSSEAAPAAVPAADPGSTLGAPPVDPNAASDAAFAQIIPAGIKLDSKTIGVGDYHSYLVSCDSIAGAETYTFTASFGDSRSVNFHAVNLHRRDSFPDEAFELTVYAVNANGVATQGSMATVN